MVDHEIFPKNQKRIFIGIAEGKSGICRLNGPWVKEERRNINRVLRAIGVFPEDMVDSVAKSLYEETYFKDSNYIVRLIAIGKAKNPEYDSKYPELLQLTYESDILPFIYNRFRKYLYQKKHHPQWDETGQSLFKLVEKAESFDEFLSNVENLMR